MVNANRLYATMLEPQHLHTVMIMLMDHNGNDRAAAHAADFPGAGHTDAYGDDDADGDNMWQWLG